MNQQWTIQHFDNDDSVIGDAHDNVRRNEMNQTDYL